jgi:hypothetical protein
VVAVIARRHIVCFIGEGLDFERLGVVAREVGGDGFEVDGEYSQHAPEPRMRKAFEACVDRVVPSFGENDWAAVDAHTDVLYMLSPTITDDDALEIAHRTLRVTAALLNAGATAAKGECSGIAHGRDRWLDLAAAADDAGGVTELAVALHLGWVRRPISDDGWWYSCGMHLLGAPDVECRADEADWLEWMDALALYLLVELPEDGVRSGEGFRLTEGGDRRVLQHQGCQRYEADDLMFNPYGYWRLTPDTSTGAATT